MKIKVAKKPQQENAYLIGYIGTFDAEWSPILTKDQLAEVAHKIINFLARGE